MRGIHHLERGRDDARRDDRADRGRRGVDGEEVEEQRPDARRGRLEPDRDAGGDSHRPLAAHEAAAQVEAGDVGFETAEPGHRAVTEDDVHRQHVRGRHPGGEAMRSTGVRGDVPADRARLLGGRVGRVVEAEAGHRVGQVEVEDAGLDPGDPIVDVDLEHPVHLRRDDHQRLVDRSRAAGEPGSAAPGDERATVTRCDLHRARDLFGRAGKADGHCVSGFCPGVAAVERELERLRARPTRTKSRFEVGDQRVSRGDPPMLLTVATRFAA